MPLLLNDAIRESAYARFAEPDMYCLAPDGDGGQDDWPYRVRLTVNIAECDMARTALHYASMVALELNAHGYALVPEVASDESMVSLTYTAPVGWDVSEVLDTTDNLVKMAYALRLDIDAEGVPVPPGHVFVPGMNDWRGSQDAVA